MCGYVISAQKMQNSPAFPGVGMDILARGPDSLVVKEVLVGGVNFFVEFSHLYITSPQRNQPIESDRFLLVLNGEIYNYLELSRRLEINESKLNDTEIFLAHVDHYGLKESLKYSNGMYSGVLIYKETGRCIGFTDHVGKKPLLLWNDSTGWHVGTGLDINYVDEKSSVFQVLVPGIHEIDLGSGRTKLLYHHQEVPACNMPLVDLLVEAVSVRIPSNQPFAIALSGGLDSSIIAYIVEKQLCLKPDYFVIAEELPEEVISLMNKLAIEHSRVNLIKPSGYIDLMELIIKTCTVVKSYNPSVVSNGVATMLLSKAVHDAGYRVLLGGEGADEFFCGYQAMYNGSHCPEGMRAELVADLHFTELRRLDLICGYHAVEARCPFLDPRVTQRALSLAADTHCNKESKTGKILLRNAYKGLLPDSIIDAHKKPFDITSGIQKKVIDILTAVDKSERNVLKNIFEEIVGSAKIFDNPYFSKYPAFDEMIDIRDKKYQLN